MKKIKAVLKRALLYLIKMLNMPKTFSEFTRPYRLEVFNMVIPFFDKNNYCSLRMDNNGEYFVIEYKRTSREEMLNIDLNNPEQSVNISKEFDIIVRGFNNQTASMIKEMIKVYLENNDFLEKTNP